MKRPNFKFTQEGIEVFYKPQNRKKQIENRNKFQSSRKIIRGLSRESPGVIFSGPRSHASC